MTGPYTVGTVMSTAPTPGRWVSLIATTVTAVTHRLNIALKNLVRFCGCALYLEGRPPGTPLHDKAAMTGVRHGRDQR